MYVCICICICICICESPSKCHEAVQTLAVCTNPTSRKADPKKTAKTLCKNSYTKATKTAYIKYCISYVYVCIYICILYTIDL